MVKDYAIISVTGFFLIFLLFFSLFPKSAMGSYDADFSPQNADFKAEQLSDLASFQPVTHENLIKRYIVFGSGPISNIISGADHVIYGMESDHGSLAMGFFGQDQVSSLKLNGYNVIEDLKLEFDSLKSDLPTGEVSRVGKIMGSEKVIHKYVYT
jgi:hypothetical protein